MSATDGNTVKRKYTRSTNVTFMIFEDGKLNVVNGSRYMSEDGATVLYVYEGSEAAGLDDAESRLESVLRKTIEITSIPAGPPEKPEPDRAGHLDQPLVESCVRSGIATGTANCELKPCDHFPKHRIDSDPAFDQTSACRFTLMLEGRKCTDPNCTEE